MVRAIGEFITNIFFGDQKALLKEMGNTSIAYIRKNNLDLYTRFIINEQLFHRTYSENKAQLLPYIAATHSVSTYRTTGVIDRRYMGCDKIIISMATVHALAQHYRVDTSIFLLQVLNHIEKCLVNNQDPRWPGLLKVV